MAAVEVTISGVLFDKYNRTTQAVVLIGEATLTGVGVGGGPVIPPGSGGGGGSPPGIWGGPIDPYPGHPLPEPPGIGTWPPQRPPHPAHPIVTPPESGPPVEPPDKPPEPVQPPIEWKVVWAGPEHGWVVVGIPNIPHPTPS